MQLRQGDVFLEKISTKAQGQPVKAEAGRSTASRGPAIANW